MKNNWYSGLILPFVDRGFPLKVKPNQTIKNLYENCFQTHSLYQLDNWIIQ